MLQDFLKNQLIQKDFYDGLDKALKRIDNTTIKFFLKENNASVRINASDIIYIEIEPIGHRKTKVVTEEKTYISSNKIAFWEEHLISSLFAQTHKSYIINMEYITKYENDIVQLDNNYNIPVSRNFKSAVHKAFVRYRQVCNMKLIFDIFLYTFEMIIAFVFISYNYDKKQSKTINTLFIGFFIFLTGALILKFVNNEILNLVVFFILNSCCFL